MNLIMTPSLDKSVKNYIQNVQLEYIDMEQSAISSTHHNCRFETKRKHNKSVINYNKRQKIRQCSNRRL